MEYRKNIGRGIEIVRVYANSPLQEIANIGRRIKTRELLQKDYWEKPLTKSQKIVHRNRVKKMHKDMKNYLNSKNK